MKSKGLVNAKVHAVLTSTERGGTKNPRKLIYHAQGTVPGLSGTGLLPVLRAFVSS